MWKKEKGFTLIELLVVIAIIGFLAALFIPNAIVSIQKAKQRRTMRDMVGIATACADYVTDVGQAPAAGSQAGPLISGSTFIQAISPFYLKNCPLTDQWGNGFVVYTGNAIASRYGIQASDVGSEDFLIVSLGRDGADGGNMTYTYDRNDPLAGLYNVNDMDDFKNDIINLNGSWIHAPRVLLTVS